jgi:hypothetical protein
MGFLSQEKSGDSSGNPLTYTVIYMVLCHLTGRISAEQFKDWFLTMVKTLEIAPGLYARTPDHQFGQNQHDEYMSLSIGEAFVGSTEHSKAIIKHGVDNYFFFDTDGEYSNADFLGRFGHVFMLIHEIAYPTKSPLVFSMLAKAAAFMRVDTNDASGCHLSFLFHAAIIKIGVADQGVAKFVRALPLTTRTYFGAGCPIIELSDELWRKESTSEKSEQEDHQGV